MVADAQRSGGMSTSAFPLVMHTHFWKRIGKSGLLKLRFRIESSADEVELDDVYETERQLLYVACTRARDRLMISGVSPPLSSSRIWRNFRDKRPEIVSETIARRVAIHVLYLPSQYL